MKSPTALLLALFLQGCVGIEVIYPTETFVRNPDLTSRSSVATRDPLPAPTPVAWVRGQHAWSPLEPIGSDRLRYNRKLNWCGVVVFLVVPVPLLFPVGYEYVELRIEDDLVVEARVVRSDSAYVLFGNMHRGDIGLHSKGFSRQATGPEQRPRPARTLRDRR